MNTIQRISTQAPEISVATPISPALERVKQMLFKPFDLGKWFVIGFCAWLATLGETGGGFNFRWPGGGHGQGGGGDFHREFEQARSYVIENLHWLVPVVAGGILAAMVLGFLITWLSSRGKFMFLHCVALDRADVAAPWSKYVREGNSLFLFRVVLGLIGLVMSVPFLAVGALAGYRMFQSHAWSAPGILALAGVGLALVLIAISFAIVRKLTMDFVVPIMYLRGKKCLEAWQEFRLLLGPNFWRFALYLVFQIVLGLVIGIMVAIFAVVTCCFCCLLVLPYVSTVVLLPVFVFGQAYPLFYLAQYGRDYDVFAAGAVPVAGPAPATA